MIIVDNLFSVFAPRSNDERNITVLSVCLVYLPVSPEHYFLPSAFEKHFVIPTYYDFFVKIHSGDTPLLRGKDI